MARDWIDSPSSPTKSISTSSFALLTVLFVFGVAIGMMLRETSSSSPSSSSILDQGEVIFLFDQLGVMSPLEIPSSSPLSDDPESAVNPEKSTSKNQTSSSSWPSPSPSSCRDIYGLEASEWRASLPPSGCLQSWDSESISH